ncbi:ATP synthase F1 subunit epsilon [Lachnospiraceae bacterium 54-53]
MKDFELHIVTPDGEFFEGRAEKLVVRTIEGDICILPRHTDFLTALGGGICRLTADGETRIAACNGGMIAVLDGKVTLSAITFEWQEEIDLKRAIKSKESAEKVLDNTTSGQERAMAEARLKRALVRINTINRNHP